MNDQIITARNFKLAAIDLHYILNVSQSQFTI